MGVLDKYGTNALKYWGSILASAYQGANISDMWTAIHADQTRYGLATPGASAPDVMVLRGYANRIANGAAAFDAANPGDAITATMMAAAPYTSRTLQDIAVNPIYHVRFDNTIQAPDGTVSTVTQTSVFTATDFPGTVGALQDAIDANATELAAQGSSSSAGSPEGVSLGTGNLEITLV